MNRMQAFFNRQYGIVSDSSYDFALRRLCVAREDSWRGILPSNDSSDFNPEPPILSAKFANCDGYRHILAIANEDGKIALQDTTQRNYELNEKALNGPQCHFNAVFDLEWAPGQMKFISASGDHTARLWDVEGSEIRSVRAFVGHNRSVKTAAFRKSDSFVFATGGRDGAIIIWDTRASPNVDMTPRVDNCILSGHAGGPGTPVSQRKRTRTRTPKMSAAATSSSITGLAFQDANTLISCGAGDGVIKVWDLRRNYTSYKKEPHPKHSLPYAGSSTFKGFTNLLVDETGARLYANCMDNTIYCYNLFSYDAKPMARYKGLCNSTFYIKSCLSPDGKYLLSGSSDEKAYIWNLQHADEPLVALSGHTVEVTCVAWGATHDRPIVTCSDDARHKIWRIGPEHISNADREEYYRGQAHYVRQFDRRPHGSTHKYNLRDLESTPRSLKRLVEQNERTPGSMEKLPAKRSFLEMLGAVPGADAYDDHEQKRPKTMESRGRRLFSPSTSGAACSGASSTSTSCSPIVRCLSLQLSAIPEETHHLPTVFDASTSPLSRNQPAAASNGARCDTNQDNIDSSTSLVKATRTPSPLSERQRAMALMAPHLLYTSPPTTTAYNSCGSLNSNASATVTSAAPLSSAIFSPTSNLPNYVLDGEAPHLGIMSPKRKHKEKIDWLTKMRKQKLMSSRRGTTIAEKMYDERCESLEPSESAPGLSSPRLQSLRSGECSPRRTLIPRRRISHSGPPQDAALSTMSGAHQPQHNRHHQPKTPTSSRRRSEMSILNFFSVQSAVTTAATRRAPLNAE